MKLAMIMYLHESVNQKALRVRNPFFWLNLIASLAQNDCYANLSKIGTKTAVFKSYVTL